MGTERNPAPFRDGHRGIRFASFNTGPLFAPTTSHGITALPAFTMPGIDRIDYPQPSTSRDANYIDTPLYPGINYINHPQPLASQNINHTNTPRYLGIHHTTHPQPSTSWDTNHIDRPNLSTSRDPNYIDTPRYLGINDTDRPRPPTSQDADRTDTPPYPGGTFAIRQRGTGRLITLVDGILRMEYCLGEQGGWHWICEETNGWLTFRSPVSGLYLGGVTTGQFCVRKHPEGGYVMLSRRDDELLRVHVGEDDYSLVRGNNMEMTWDFEEINRSRIVQRLDRNTRGVGVQTDKGLNIGDGGP
ncbi:hypothetical protein Hte_010518 [Hypoxylon texense]